MASRLSIEIGGTKLQAAVGSADGEIRQLRRCPVPAGSKARDILVLAAQLGSKAIEGETIERVGIGFGGPVDVEGGRVVRSFHVDGWDDFPLGEWAADTFGVGCAIENDTNCGALAEATLGAGVGADVIFYTNIGSGIGGGLVIDGKLYSRPVGCCEIGHTKLWDRDTDEYCIVEHLCSGWSIDRMARQLAAAGGLPRATALAGGDANTVSAEHIAAAAMEGESAASELIERVADDFSVALCNVISLLNPDRIIVGGGVSLMGETLLAPLRKCVARRVFQPYADRCEILPAALGENVVLIGALLI